MYVPLAVSPISDIEITTGSSGVGFTTMARDTGLPSTVVDSSVANPTTGSREKINNYT